MRKKRGIQSIPYVCIGIAFAIATFYDLQINTFLYHPNSWFGIIFERFVLFPITLLVPIAFYARYRVKDSYISFVAYVIGCIYVCLDVAHFWVNLFDYLPWLLAAALLFIIITSVLQRVSLFFWKKHEHYLTYIMSVFLISMCILLCMKWGWGRVRYREMLEDVSVFTPWYLPQGYTGHMSFPSGHTTAMSVVLCFLDAHREQHQHPPFWWQYILIFGVIIAMMLSRMILGAHFLSDVTMGFCITYTVFSWTRRRFYQEVRR